MLLAAVLVAVLVAPLTERGLLRFFYGRDEVLLVLVTYAMFLMMEDLTKLIWGANPFYVSEPYGMFGSIDIGTQTYVGYDFMLVALAVVVGLGVWWGLNRTRFGKIVTAVIHSAEVASSMGIQVSRVYMLAFAVGIFLAALGGAFTAPMLSVQPGLSVGVIIISFAVVIIGGLGSIEGAAIGRFDRRLGPRFGGACVASGRVVLGVFGHGLGADVSSPGFVSAHTGAKNLSHDTQRLVIASFAGVAGVGRRGLCPALVDAIHAHHGHGQWLGVFGHCVAHAGRRGGIWPRPDVCYWVVMPRPWCF
jgi:hypothetical protein